MVEKLNISNDFINGTNEVNPNKVVEKVKVIEELSELQQAISKSIRDEEDPVWNLNEAWKAAHRDNLEEEIADVIIGIEKLVSSDEIDPMKIQKWIYLKEERQMLKDYKKFINPIEHPEDETYSYDALAYLLECKQLYEGLSEDERRSIMYHNPDDTKNL